MVSLDIFHQDGFRMIQLTAAVEKVPYLPATLLDMGIFEDSPIRTEAMAVEERDGQLVLVPFSDRGSAGTQRTTEQRKLRYFQVPRIKVEDTISASELAGIREFGSETELMQLQKEMMRRMVGPTGLRSILAYTQEYHRLAAIQGLLLDADGSTKFNWFSEFGITAPPEVEFNLLARVPATLRPICNQITRGMKRAAKGSWIEGRTRPAALCGDAFFDSLVTHPDVEKTYLNWMQAVELRQNTAFEVFNFASIDWINYRGSDDTLSVQGTTTAASNVVAGVAAAAIALLAVGNAVNGPGIPAGATIAATNSGAGTITLQAGQNAAISGTFMFNMGTMAITVAAHQAKFFPRFAPGIFRRGLAPANSFEWINTLGKPEYVRAIPDMARKEWVKIEMESYPLHICTRPEVLQTGTMDAIND